MMGVVVPVLWTRHSPAVAVKLQKCFENHLVLGNCMSDWFCL